jgi:PKD repeat protein
MKRIIIGIIIVALVLTTVACSSKTETIGEERVNSYSLGLDSSKPTYSGSTGTIVPTPPPQITLEIPPDEGVVVQSSPSEITSTTTSTTDRLVVRTGNIDIVVEDVQVTIDDITQLAESMQGFVVSSTTWRSGNALYGSISIRVPADSYNSVLKIIRDTAIEVNSENTSASDVTEQYIDLQAKLSNLEATEQQLLKIMEQATTVESILKVQSQLSATRSEIERTKGSIQYLERTAAMSLLQIQLQQAKLYAEITVNKAVVQARDSVYFYAEISGGFSPFSYEWDFGDGSTSTNPEPAHSYKSPGDYTISLKVTDDRGNTVTATRDNYINVLAGWDVGNTVQSAWNGLSIFGQVLLNILIWLGIFSPVWIIGGGIAFYFWWRNRKRKATQKNSPALTETNGRG